MNGRKETVDCEKDHVGDRDCSDSCLCSSAGGRRLPSVDKRKSVRRNEGQCKQWRVGREDGAVHGNRRTV